MRVSIDCAWAIAQAASKASAAVPENRMCLIIDASWTCCRFSSLHLLNISWFPTFFGRPFGRAVEALNREIVLARHCGEPAALLAVRCVGDEIDVGTAIGVRHW